MIFGVTKELKLKSNSEPRKPRSPGCFVRAAPGFTPAIPCHCGAPPPAPWPCCAP